MKRPNEHEKESSAEIAAEEDSRKTNRRFQVSSNRGSATHRVRYVESGGAAVDANCCICKPAVRPR